MTDQPQNVETPVERSPWGLLGLMLATFFALNAATLLLPHDPYIRYQQLLPTLQYRAVWGYERMAFDKTPIDVAIIGNSRLQAAISSPALEDRLTRELGRPIHVANLSMPQEGQNVHYVIARQLMRTHPEVKLIIFSAIEQMPREGHPAFRNIAEASDLVSAPVLLNTEYFSDLSYVPYRQMSLFVQTLFPEAFGNHVAFDAANYIGPRFDSTRSFDTPTGGHVDRDGIHTAEELMPDARVRATSITPPLLPAWAKDQEFAKERFYTREIADLANANGTRLVFLYTPIFHFEMPVQDADFYTARGSLLEARFLAADPRNFSDYGHVNRIGAAKVTQWLGDRMVEAGWLGQPAGKDDR